LFVLDPTVNGRGGFRYFQETGEVLSVKLDLPKSVAGLVAKEILKRCHRTGYKPFERRISESKPNRRAARG